MRSTPRCPANHGRGGGWNRRTTTGVPSRGQVHRETAGVVAGCVGTTGLRDVRRGSTNRDPDDGNRDTR